jgi:hypothetical protein
VRYPQSVRRAGSVAGSLLALVRRRREERRPRVRVRVAQGETIVLPEDAPERARLLSLAEQLVGEYGRQARAER